MSGVLGVTFLRFTLWNLGVRLCDVIGGPMNTFALWFEARTGRESWIYGCMTHPYWLLPHHDAIPERWWGWFGWHP